MQKVKIPKQTPVIGSRYFPKYKCGAAVIFQPMYLYMCIRREYGFVFNYIAYFTVLLKLGMIKHIGTEENIEIQKNAKWEIAELTRLNKFYR